VRIISGKKTDEIVDSSRVKGLGHKTIIYDRKDKNNVVIKGPETKLKLSKDKNVNEYNRKLFKYNKIMPLAYVGYNIDDGIAIGGGVNFLNYRFRDSTIHKIRGRIAFRTGAFLIKYDGLVSSFSEKMNFAIAAEVSMPRNVDNFFGLGNETVKQTDDKAYYRVRYSYAFINPKLEQNINKQVKYSLGVFYQYFMVDDTADRFIGNMQENGLDSLAYINHHFAGFNASFEIDTRDNEIMPKRGVFWDTDLAGYIGADEDSKDFVKLRSDLSMFFSFRKDPRVVFAFRFGGAANFGNYEFYHANFLSGKTNLRGFRSNRFAGDISFYQNTEIRLKLLNLRNYLFNGQTGILFFSDIGRVWVKHENSKRWHYGFGAGAWLAPFNFTTLTVSYNLSAEENFLMFTFSYLF